MTDVAGDLTVRFPDLEPATVRAAVADAFGIVSGSARYDAYLPILVARRATAQLRSALR